MSIKPVKFLSLLLLALTVATVCLACKSTEAGLSAEQVLENTLAAQQDVNSFRLDATVTVDVQSADTQASVSGDVSCALDLADREMEATADMGIKMPGMTLTAEMEAYLVDNYAYVMTSVLGQTQWMKQAIPADAWQNIENGQYQTDDLLQYVEAEIVKEESLNGINCYVLSLTPDLGKLQLALMEQPGIGAQLAEMPDLESIVKKMSFKVWVAKDNYFVMKADIGMTLVMDPETMGIPGGEGTATMELSLQMVASDYNQPISVELPAEALSAEEDASGLDLPFF